MKASSAFTALALLAGHAIAASSSDTTESPSIVTLTGSSISTPDYTGSDVPYSSYTGQRTVSSVSTTSSGASNSTRTSSGGSGSQITASSTSASLIEINGQTYTTNSTTNQTSTSTTSSAQPTNTVPCNNYPEFCSRKYSNITEVCAHNSAFAVKNNAASNQRYGILDQLNNGVRMIQGETHYVNGTIYNCHTSCDLLNAGPLEDSLGEIADWVARHPYDVVTILLVNSDYAQNITVENYVETIQNSGIARFLYEPKYVPQYRDQWPTLGEMILTGKRVVMFMDYNANQTAVPYVLDEFSHMWETPYSPTNESFPCDQQRPPGLDPKKARDQFMYLANHNLNVAIDISAILGDGGDTNILIPDTSRINRTNGSPDQFGMLGAMNANCTEQWGHPPNFLLVDYFERGDPDAGSVFEVAARANNVTYRKVCCDNAKSAASPAFGQGGNLALSAAAVLALVAFVI